MAVYLLVSSEVLQAKLEPRGSKRLRSLTNRRSELDAEPGAGGP
jgi:hypothetical protein